MTEDREEMSITQKLVAPKMPTNAAELSVVKKEVESLLANDLEQESLKKTTDMQAQQALPPPLSTEVVPKGQIMHPKSYLIKSLSLADAQKLERQCQRLCLSVFFRERAPARSLGFTSSISGEGKSFLAMAMAEVLSTDSGRPVTLVECDWEHPSLAEYLGLPAVPGLAEWIRNECNERYIRYQITHNFTIIPAGNKKQDAVQLLQQIRLKGGFVNTLAPTNEFLIVDLPAILTTGYGSLAASLVESLIVVVQTGVTPDLQIAESCKRLEELPVQGIILNQQKSRIPRWIKELLL